MVRVACAAAQLSTWAVWLVCAPPNGRQMGRNCAVFLTSGRHCFLVGDLPSIFWTVCRTHICPFFIFVFIFHFCRQHPSAGKSHLPSLSALPLLILLFQCIIFLEPF
ncbi:hypothetical protein F4802DRAFT_469664 [Xylaria palmicola]|nr:hypothetical protein F4802DRAFT_469664 [Xylaria palmicola]